MIDKNFICVLIVGIVIFITGSIFNISDVSLIVGTIASFTYLILEKIDGR